MEEVFDKTSGLVFIFVQDEVLVSWAFSFLSFSRFLDVLSAF